MRNLAVVSSDESTILILCTPSEFALQSDHWFHDGLKFYSHYLWLKNELSDKHFHLFHVRSPFGMLP